VVTPAITAAFMFLVDMMLSGFYGDWWTQLVPVTWPTPDIFTEWNDSALAAQVVWLAGLGGIVAVVVTARRHSGRTFVAATSGTGAVAVIGAWCLIPWNGHYYAAEAPTYQEACAGQTPEVCVHPAFAPALPALVEEFHALMAKLEGTSGYATRLQHRWRGRGSDPDPGKSAIHLDRLKEANVRAAVGEYIEEQLDSDSCYSEQGLDALEEMDAVYAWLSSQPSGTAHLTADAGGPAQAWFESHSEAEKRAWLRDHWSAFTRCRIGPDDFR
jgi:hypothetical protein